MNWLCFLFLCCFTSLSFAQSNVGAIRISGAERTISSQPTGAITISGRIMNHRVCGGGGDPTDESSPTLGRNPSENCTYYPGTGEIDAVVNGVDSAIFYAMPDTATSLATNLAQAITQNSAGTVTASASGATITITQSAVGGGYSLAASSSSDYGTPDDFTLNASGYALTGGGTIYDNGSVSVTLGSVTETTAYAASDTNLTIANNLAIAFFKDCNSPYQAQVGQDDLTGTALPRIHLPAGWRGRWIHSHVRDILW